MTKRVTPEREFRLAPYAAEERESRERAWNKGKEPRGLGGLLHWYEEEWTSEVPDRLHTSAIWQDDGLGSAIGSPAWSDPFRRYLEHSARELDEDGYFLRPVHAALADMSHRQPLIARLLLRLAWAGFTVDGVELVGEGALPTEYKLVLCEQGLRGLWARWQPAPRVKAA